jgi:hypothetical protein
LVGGLSNASAFASEDVTVVSTIAAGDQLGIDTVANALSAAGETYTAAAAAGGAYPAFDFVRAAGDANTTAANLATSINANSRIVWASVSGAIVTLTARIAGTAANSVDLAALIESGGAGTAFTLGGATLANGADGAVTTSSEIGGLVAYLLDHVCNAFLSIGSGGSLETSPLTLAEANTIATAILALVTAGTALTLANINTAINTPTTVSGSDLDGAGALSDSSGSVEDILNLLSGSTYTIPSGSTIASSTSNKTVFDSASVGSFSSSTSRRVETTGALQISVGSGRLSKFMSDDFSYLGTTGRAIVVYNDDGSLF